MAGTALLKREVRQNSIGKSMRRSQILADFMVIGALKP